MYIIPIIYRSVNKIIPMYMTGLITNDFQKSLNVISHLIYKLAYCQLLPLWSCKSTTALMQIFIQI
jgi:hypothetical protein